MKPTREQVTTLAKNVWYAGGLYIGPSIDSLYQFAEAIYAVGLEKGKEANSRESVAEIGKQ